MIKITLKIITILILSYGLFGDISFGAYSANSIQNSISPTGGDSINAVDNGNLSIDGNNSLLNDLLKYIKDSMSYLLSVISIGVFIYIGGKLVIAKGNPEEFKKALTNFIYAVIGIFVVTVAWLAVKLVSGLDIN